MTVTAAPQPPVLVPAAHVGRADLFDLVREPGWIGDTSIETNWATGERISLRDAAEGAARFRVDRTGDRPRFVPDTRRAVELLASERGEHLQGMLDGVLAQQAGFEDRTDERGLVISDTPEQAKANFIIARIDAMRGRGADQIGSITTWLPDLGPGSTPATRDSFTRLTAQHANLDNGLLSAQNLGWIVLNHEWSQAALDAAAPDADPRRAGAVAALLVHEANHAVTPTHWNEIQDAATGTLRPAAWLDEAAVDLVATRPAAIERYERASGIDVVTSGEALRGHEELVARTRAWMRREGANASSNAQVADVEQVNELVGSRYAGDREAARAAVHGGAVYPYYVEVLEDLLRRGGMNPDDPAQEPAVRELLQGTPFGELPQRIATMIATTAGFAEVPDEVELLEQGIRDVGPDGNTWEQQQGIISRHERLVQWLDAAAARHRTA